MGAVLAVWIFGTQFGNNDRWGSLSGEDMWGAGSSLRIFFRGAVLHVRIIKGEFQGEDS